MKISRNPFLRVVWPVWLGFGWAPVCLCLCGLAGCSGKSSTDEKVQNPPPATTDPASQTPVEEDLIPKGAKKDRTVTETEYFANGTPRKERGVHIYKLLGDGGELPINDGPYKEYYPDGTLFITGLYKDGRRTGFWEFKHKNGKLAHKEHYENGKLEGAWTIYREDGTKSDDVAYHQNKKSGTWVEYDAKEQVLSRTELKDGMQNGPRTEYYPSGKIRPEGHFTNNKFDGLMTHWYENGKKKLEVEFKLGVKNGKEIEYNDRGDIISSREFRDGRLVPKKSG